MPHDLLSSWGDQKPGRFVIVTDTKIAGVLPQEPQTILIDSVSGETWRLVYGHFEPCWRPLRDYEEVEQQYYASLKDEEKK